MKQTSRFTLFSSFSISVILFLFSSFAQAENNASMRLCKVAATQAAYPCSVGKGGIRIDKKEGDGTTPVGHFLIREIFYRADKLKADEIAQLKKTQANGFSVKALTPDDGWVDDVKSPDYNRFVKLSTLKDKTTSHENLWRNDDMYDIIAVIGYNDNPVVKGKGSAIFMHVARPLPSGGYGPTVGCVGFSKPDLLKVLATITPKTHIEIPLVGKIILN
jgi:L,D-peptidoglycan transpeptidase YkuD (ErfK/YbiS/YcfS/YnhG family)